MPLRECRYSLGDTVLKIAGAAAQQARWAAVPARFRVSIIAREILGLSPKELN